jgi:hypothetical protein
MSEFDKLPLPPTIGVRFDEKVDVKQIEARPDSVVICHSKDLSNEDLDTLRENGKILRWSAHLSNLDFSKLDFDFLLVDLREKDARLQLGKQELEGYHVVLYVRWFEKNDAFVEELKGHCISSLPKRWVSKQDFLSQLITPKITSPSVFRSFLRLVLQCWRS